MESEVLGSNPNAHPMIQPPGLLQGAVYLTLQTRQAYWLLHGNKKPVKPIKPAEQNASQKTSREKSQNTSKKRKRTPIAGLMPYGRRLSVIWTAAKRADPYADWWLLRIDQALKKAREQIEVAKTALDEDVGIGCALQMDMPVSVQPYRVPLRFGSPYGFLGAQMLAEYDAMMCQHLSQAHVGMMASQSQLAQIAACETSMRAAFRLPLAYHDLGLTRVQIIQGGDSVSRAIVLMGYLPESILQEKELAPLRPKRIHSGTDHAPDPLNVVEGQRVEISASIPDNSVSAEKLRQSSAE